ncbi:MAG: FHA domain-containing protein [Chloroflexi bacterium]|nr:FHA domain-containing protein [Chloroflexota bacterium]
MINVCPNCHHQELEGALFCSECGTKLVEQSGLSTAAIPASDSRAVEARKSAAPPPSLPEMTGEAVASLHIVRTGQILPLVGRDEFTIGRVSEGQSILPDIDLTPYEAYSQGVSRLHATIKIQGDDLMIIDLGSSNGTRINNNKVTPHEEREIQHGDVIALGQFKIQALLRQDEP